jgi:thiamine biosynthesis lipoprotein
MLQTVKPQAGTPADAPTWQWYQHSFRAMNTNVHTRLYSPVAADEILVDVQRLFASFEKTLSRFDSASELSRLNTSKNAVFTAGPTLIDAVEIALWAADITNGLYDPTILNHLEQAGYDRSFDKITQVASFQFDTQPPAATSHPATSTPFSFRSVQLNRARRKIYKPVGVRLDLGGMGKGWTVDRAADRLQGLGPFLVNAGGDIFAYQSPPGQKGWAIDLIHPLKPNQFIGQVLLHHQALATSTVAKRRWQRNGRIQHHLIDPRTGQPAQTDVLSATVVTNRTVLAEVVAKVVLILGVEQGLDYLQRLPGVEGLIFTADSNIRFTAGFEPLLTGLDSTA